MSAEQECTIVVDHVGPVERFEARLTGYGVHELRGTKGQGKTTVLDSVDLLQGRRVSLTVTDGFLVGTVSGLNTTCYVGGKKRRKGKPNINSLDFERFGLADVVSPQVKDPEAADIQRIKALVSLRGVEAEPADYYDLADGRANLEALLPPEKLQTDDPVLLASRVKEAMEAKARIHEATAKHEHTHAESHKLRAEGVDLTAEADAQVLQDRMNVAKTRQLSLQQQRKAHADDVRRRQEAQERLAAAESNWTGPTLQQASQELERARQVVATEDAEILRLNTLLAEARQRQVLATERQLSASRQESASRQHDELCAAWRAAIVADPVASVADEDLALAAQAVAQAQTELEQGVRVRDAMQASALARKHRKTAEEQEDLAKQWRSKASGVFDVLSSLVHCPGLKIESVGGAPRCVVIHPRRGKMLYHDMSDGERVYVAIEAVIDTLDTPAAITIAQRLWQDLPPADRMKLHQYGLAHEIYIFGAQVSDDENLRLVYYGDAPPMEYGMAT